MYTNSGIYNTNQKKGEVGNLQVAHLTGLELNHHATHLSALIQVIWGGKGKLVRPVPASIRYPARRPWYQGSQYLTAGGAENFGLKKY